MCVYDSNRLDRNSLNVPPCDRVLYSSTKEQEVFSALVWDSAKINTKTKSSESNTVFPFGWVKRIYAYLLIGSQPLIHNFKIQKTQKIKGFFLQFSSVAQSCPTLWDPMNCSTRPPFPSPTPWVHSNSHPSSRWCHPAISSSVVPFSTCPQSLPASGSFPVSQLFAWGGQSSGVSAVASFLPKNTQDWSPLEWTGWISLQSKGLSRVFSNTTVQRHQFFSPQLSSQSNSHIHTWLVEKP